MEWKAVMERPSGAELRIRRNGEQNIGTVITTDITNQWKAVTERVKRSVVTLCSKCENLIA